jgi:hypothetical protein
MKNVFNQTPQDKQLMDDLLEQQVIYTINLKIKTYLDVILNSYIDKDDKIEIKKLSTFIKTAIETSNEGLDQEWGEWERAYVSDALYYCQIIDEKAFASFLIDRWESFKSFCKDNDQNDELHNIKTSYKKFVEKFKDYEHNDKLSNSIIVNNINANLVMTAYNVIAQYSHLYSPNPEKFRNKVLLIFNIFNKNFMSLFEDPDKKVIHYVSVIEDEKIETACYLSVPNLIAATKMSYDDILQKELIREKQANEKKLQDQQNAGIAKKDFEQLVKKTKKWNRLNSEAECFIIGDIDGLLLDGINYLTADNCYYIFCCQIADENNNDKIIDVRLPGVIYNLGFDNEKQFCGKLNIYPSTGKIGIVPIEATDYDKLQEALYNGSVVQIDRKYLLASFDNNALLITDQDGKIIEAIDCEII